jgi:mannose-6-phosphate isomerase class I
MAGLGEDALFQEEHLSVHLITTARRSDMTAPEALTILWPLAGQGRVLTNGPAPTTRLSPGRAILLPAALGRYAVESGGTVSYLLIESR